MTNKIMIEPAVALNELTIDHAYSRDRRLYLANELHQMRSERDNALSSLEAAQHEINRLNEVIEDMQSRAAEASEFDQAQDVDLEDIQ